MVGDTGMATSNIRARILFVPLFVILLLLGTTAGVTHVHPDGAGHTDCALCQNTHNIASPSAAPQIVPVVFVVARIILPPVHECRELFFSYTHWNKPPPDQSAVA